MIAVPVGSVAPHAQREGRDPRRYQRPVPVRIGQTGQQLVLESCRRRCVATQPTGGPRLGRGTAHQRCSFQGRSTRRADVMSPRTLTRTPDDRCRPSVLQYGD
ncbi:hypothetical protein JDM601_1959 [Mycolicibacter sinensis]|uniref:Uncharacterized protein n=1 Tax=Mycolicibacter sinensis (strain JDM601) TaxID=875328 RepID=F5Z3Q9_MYCSD|nr:hypothetical protein JDM601_1959 [Mycolicibacter sinensis]